MFYDVYLYIGVYLTVCYVFNPWTLQASVELQDTP